MQYVVDPILDDGVIMDMPKFMSWKKDIDRVINFVAAAGLYQHYASAHLHPEATVHWSPKLEEVIPLPLTLSHLLVAFILVSAGLLICLVVFHVEILIEKHRQNTEQPQDT